MTTLYEQLSEQFPQHSHFFEVRGMTFGDALERCARLTGDAGEVLNLDGRVIFACKHDIGAGAVDIDWLWPVEGTPVDVQPQ